MLSNSQILPALVQASVKGDVYSTAWTVWDPWGQIQTGLLTVATKHIGIGSVGDDDGVGGKGYGDSYYLPWYKT